METRRGSLNNGDPQTGWTSRVSANPLENRSPLPPTGLQHRLPVDGWQGTLDSRHLIQDASDIPIPRNGLRPGGQEIEMRGRPQNSGLEFPLQPVVQGQGYGEGHHAGGYAHDRDNADDRNDGLFAPGSKIPEGDKQFETHSRPFFCRLVTGSE